MNGAKVEIAPGGDNEAIYHGCPRIVMSGMVTFELLDLMEWVA